MNLKKLFFSLFFISNFCLSAEHKEDQNNNEVTFVTEVSSTLLQDGKIQKTIKIIQKDNEKIYFTIQFIYEKYYSTDKTNFKSKCELFVLKYFLYSANF